MSDSIERGFALRFPDDIREGVQQKGSRLLSTVDVEACTGAQAHYVDILDPASAPQKHVTRHGPTVRRDLTQRRRENIVQDFIDATLIDDQDKLKMMYDPSNKYLAQLIHSLGRQIDDLIIASATGSVTEITTDPVTKTSSSVTLPTAQTIAKDFTIAGGGSNSHLTFEKLLETHAILTQAEALDGGETPNFIINAKALRGLLAETELTSQDFNTVRSLVSGEVNTFLGFNFIRTERLSGAGTSGDPTLCLAYVPSAIVFGLAEGVTTFIDRLPDFNQATQLYARMSGAAVRVQDEKVVSIECVI